MKKYLYNSTNGLFGFALVLLLIVNFYAAYIENPLFLNISKLLFVPVFLVAFLAKKRILSLAFMAFLMFSFVGDLFPFLFAEDVFMANALYFMGYVCLLVIAIFNFRFDNIDKIVGTYLLVVLLINSYFLYTICNVLNVLIIDKMEMMLFGAKSWTLMLLAFTSFAVYLSNQSKASILFLIMAISFVFSDVLNYINHYYIYNWSILMLERGLHIVAIFFAFKYVMEQSSARTKKYLQKDINHENIFLADNVLA
ncbi:hypothetical protein KO566_10840 [Flavobacteriaceae bacterium XHP0103]|uniref:hypothetical protein n=1 Tax=Marixanthotalea marina TaxID=2844359 RepID=UPI002989A25D|nr:hypothetical protein [Marixanthotalea marina]MBU3822560.1 hypothetical protein [Marixanthotalea marina]